MGIVGAALVWILDDEPSGSARASTSTNASTIATTTSTTRLDVLFPSRPNPTWGGVLEFLVDGSLHADGFNHYIAEHEPSWQTDARAAALALFGIDETPVQTTLEPRNIPTIDVVDNAGGTTTVTITTEGPGDDSVAGSRKSVTFARAADGTVRFQSGSWAYLCHRGPTAGTYVPKICP